MRELIGESEVSQRYKKEKETNIKWKSYSNRVYMHSYCSNGAYLHTFTLTDVGIFWVIMCKMMQFLYYARFCNH